MGHHKIEVKCLWNSMKNTIKIGFNMKMFHLGFLSCFDNGKKSPSYIIYKEQREKIFKICFNKNPTFKIQVNETHLLMTNT